MGRRDKPIAVDMATTVGARMRLARQRADVSLTVFAERIGFEKSYLSNAETGKQRPSAALVAKYEEELNLMPGTLTSSSEDTDPASPTIMTNDVVVSGDAPTTAPREAIKASRRIYPRIVDICKRLEAGCYCPARLVNPQTDAGALFTDWDKEDEIIKGCGVLVMYIGVPSYRVGAHMALAHLEHVPTVLLCDSARLQSATSLAFGHDEVAKIIPFKEPDDFVRPLAEQLYRLLCRRSLKAAEAEAATRHQHWTSTEYQAKLAWIDRAFPANTPLEEFKPLRPGDWRKMVIS